MANEITTTLKTVLSNPTTSTTTGLVKAVFDQGTIQLTQTTAAVFSDTVTVTTSEQDIALPTNSKFTAALQGLFCVVNLDATNYVKLGPKSAGDDPPVSASADAVLRSAERDIAMGRRHGSVPGDVRVAGQIA
jgi:hypothetical protein